MLRVLDPSVRCVEEAEDMLDRDVFGLHQTQHLPQMDIPFEAHTFPHGSQR
jgi:hypothetical protein